MKRKGKRKAEVLHEIPFTVAGMPRPGDGSGIGGGGAGSDSASYNDKRGPRDGTVVASADWTLRDLKQAIAQNEGVHFTPDAAPRPSTWIKTNVTVAPNVTVPIKVDPAQTVQSLWRMVASAAAAVTAAAAAAAAAAQPGNDSGPPRPSNDAEAATAAAVAAAIAAGPRFGRDSDHEDEDEQDGRAAAGTTSKDDDDDDAFVLPLGQVLMRQATRAATAVPTYGPSSPSPGIRLLSDDSAADFLCFPDDVLGREGCRLQDGEELILVGPGAVSADDIPSWMVRVLVLGQPVGCISVPNRRLAEEVVPDSRHQQPSPPAPAPLSSAGAGDGISTKKAGSSTGGGGGVTESSASTQSTAGGQQEQQQEQHQQMRTLSDLRRLLSKELHLPSDQTELWILPPSSSADSSHSGSGSGGSRTGVAGMEPEEPRGEKAVFDNMSLGHYGLVHGGTVDVRLRPSSPGKSAEPVAGASGKDAAAAAAAAMAVEGTGQDVVRISVKTNGMMLRDEDGSTVFVSKSTFSMDLLDRLAARTLKIARNNVTRTSFDRRPMFKRWLRDFGDEISSETGLIVYVAVPTIRSHRKSSRWPRNLSDSNDDDSEAPVRTTMALWVMEPEIDHGTDPLGITNGSLGPLSSTVYPLRSTFDSDSVGLEEWGLLREGVHVFAVFYMTRSAMSASELAASMHPVARESNFGTSLCWYSRPVPRPSSGPRRDIRDVGSKPEDDDSKAGKACFLSCAYMLCHYICMGGREENGYGGDADGGDCVGWLLRELMALLSPRFPPAALALQQLGKSDDVTEGERACLVQCLWGLAREMVPRQVADASVLENSRTFLSWLVSRASTSREDAQRERSRQLAIKKKVKTAAAAATAAAAEAAEIDTAAGVAGGSPAASSTDAEAAKLVPEKEANNADTVADSGDVSKVEPRAEVERLSVHCCRLVERLEPGHAVRLRVDGDLIDGVYSSGGAQQKRQELLPNEGTVTDADAAGSGGGAATTVSGATAGAASAGASREKQASGGDSAGPRTVEVIPWEAAGRLLLACPFAASLPVLRFTPPKGKKGGNKNKNNHIRSFKAAAAAAAGTGSSWTGKEEEEEEKEEKDLTSWLSLVDWPTCVRRTSDHAFLRVVAPLSLMAARTPALTRDRDGHLCVFTGKGKSALKSMLLFTPLNGGQNLTEDAHVIAQCLERLRKSKDGLPGGEFEEAVTAARVAREIVMVCMDSSYSMGGRPGFDDDEDPEDKKDKRPSYPRKLEFDWSAPPPREGGNGDDDADNMQVVDLTGSDGYDYDEEEEEEEEDEDDQGYEYDGDDPYSEEDDDSDDDEMEDISEDDGAAAGTGRQRKGVCPELRRRRFLLTALLRRECLPQLQEMASLLQIRLGEWTNPTYLWGKKSAYTEMVLEELVLEHFDANSTASWATAELDMKVYRRYRKEFLDVLLKKGRYRDRDGESPAEEDDLSQWAPRQFLCPITQALIMDPVVADDGHSYERHAILEWFSRCRVDDRPPTSPMTGAAMGSNEIVTSNHALKSRIRDWVVERNRAEDERAKDEAEDVKDGVTGGDAGSASREPLKDLVKVDVRFGSKRLTIKVDRRSGAKGIAGLKNLVSSWKAESVMSPGAPPTPPPPPPPPTGTGIFSVGVSSGDVGGVASGSTCDGGGSGGGAGGTETGGGSGDTSGASSASPAWEPSATISPKKIQLFHGGNSLKSLRRLKNGDVVIAVEVKGRLPPTYTVKIKSVTNEEVYLLSRRYETVFSLKLRLWLREISNRPSRAELWYGLQDVGDGVQSGNRLRNEALLIDFARDDGNQAQPVEICAFSRDPYKKESKNKRPALTRLDAVKQLFHAYINRVQAYDLAQEVGLISFGSEAIVACEPTAVLEDFRDEVDDISHHGDTTLWDALSEACTLLEKWKTEWREKARARAVERRGKRRTIGVGTSSMSVPTEEDPILRIMVLSDGDDTKSTASAHAVCSRLQKVGVVVDSIIVGTEKNNRLKCLSLATSGYAFHPKTLREAMRLNEQETVLSAGQRERQRATAGIRGVSSESQLLSHERLGAEFDTEETVTLKEDPMIKSTCKPLAAALSSLGPADNVNVGGGSGGAREAVHPERQRRVQREMMDMIKNPHQAFEVFPSDENMHFWKVLLAGPGSTPYGGGCWMLSVFFPNSYPSVAPKVRFVTPIRHCNINSHGRVCHAIFDRSWTPNTSIADILACVYGLLLYPDHDDPLDSTLALSMYDSDGQYEAAIMEHVRIHASKPQRVWVTEMEAEAMASEERLVSSLRTLQQAKDSLAAERFDDAKEKAQIAAVFAAGGPAPIAGPQSRLTQPTSTAHRAQLPGLNAARAAASMVFAWAVLMEGPAPKLDVVETAAGNARLFDASSPEISGILAEVAERRWKMCDPGSWKGLKRLKEAVRHQTAFVRMLDSGSAARKKAKKALDILSKELERASPPQQEEYEEYVGYDEYPGMFADENDDMASFGL